MTQNFVLKLQQQAKKQAKLQETRLLPKQLDFLSSLIGRYPLASLIILSLLGAVIWEIIV